MKTCNLSRVASSEIGPVCPICPSTTSIHSFNYHWTSVFRV